MLNLKINNITPVQDDFWGNGAVYHGFAGMPDDSGRVYSDELCELEAKRVTNMKLKIARTYYTWWAWDKNTNTWDWDNKVMTAFYKWLQRMKDGGVSIALNTGWWCPTDLLSNGHAGPSPFTVENDWEQTLKNYGDWVSETYKQLVINRGFTNIKIFVIFTEPQNYKVDTIGSFERWRDCIKAAHNALVRDGYRDKIVLMGPNEGSTTTSPMLKWTAENADEFIDVYSSHNYIERRNVPKNFVKTGNSVVTLSRPGARICRIVKLKPNTDYVAYIDVMLKILTTEEMRGRTHFGIFPDDGRVDIHNPDGFGPNLPLSEGSMITILPEEHTSEYQRISISFNSGDNTSGVIGYFHDVKVSSTSVVEQFCINEKGSDVNIVPNGNFEDGFSGWKEYFCGNTQDSYFDWYKWSKIGMGFIQSGKPYCFDEYNEVFSHDYSRDEHGAEMATAALAFMNSGAKFSLLWTLFDQQWPNNHTNRPNSFYDGDHRCGTMPLLTRTLVPHKSFYAFTLVSRYVDGDGTKVYEGFGKNCIHTTMAVSKNGDVTIIVVNANELDEEFKIDFYKPLSNIILNRHSFNPKTLIPDEKAEVIFADKVLKDVSNSLSDTIPAHSVYVYTTKE